MNQRIEKVSDIKEEIKKIPREKTLAQKLLPGIILLILSVTIGVSINEVGMCDKICLLKGGGIGTSTITIL